MSTFLKTIFLPVANRHFTDKKTSFLVYAFSQLPLALFLIVPAIIFKEASLLLILSGLLILALVDYFVFDALSDKITWKLFWSRFYKKDYFASTEAHDAIKAYEKSPTEENRLAVEKHIQKTVQDADSSTR